MIVIHSGVDFSCTNMFQFDIELRPQADGSIKKNEVIRNIKKLFNFDCNNYVTLVAGEKYTVIAVRGKEQKAYDCEMFADRLRIVKELDININPDYVAIANKRLGKVQGSLF